MKNLKRRLLAGDIAYIILILVIDCLYGRKWFSGRFLYTGVILVLNLLCLAGMCYGPGLRKRTTGVAARVTGIIWFVIVPPAILLVVQVLAGKDFRLQGTGLLLNLLVYYLLELILSAAIGQIAAAQSLIL